MSEEGRYIKGGDGSHWVGCEETHWDCKIARLEKENARLQKAARNMIDKLNKIQYDSNYIGIFQMANIHGLQYNGENYSKEYDELLAILEEHEKGT